MSELVVITGGASATIYGTFADGTTYITTSFGDTYTAWLELDPDDQKRTLIAAARFLDQQVWIDDYDTFEERDAVPAFQNASYELGVLIADDPDVLTAFDNGSNIQALNAGPAGVTFFNPTSATAGSATLLPPVIERLLGAFLSVDVSTAGAPQGAGSGCVSPFSKRDDYDRNEPY